MPFERTDKYLQYLVYLTESRWKSVQMKRNARVGNQIARRKEIGIKKKNAKSAAHGEIAIESDDEKSPQWQGETRVALPKDPYRRGVTRSFLDRLRTALVYHERTFCTLDIAPISSRFPTRWAEASRRDATCGLHDRRSWLAEMSHQKSRRRDPDDNLQRVSDPSSRANNAKRDSDVGDEILCRRGCGRGRDKTHRRALQFTLFVIHLQRR